VRLIVSDTGTGIAPAVFERMFDPFFTTKGIGEGTGLGLSLVHGIVTDLGGAINVQSRAGEGTSFEIWLPTAGETSKAAAEAVQEIPRGNGETVMIVDDEQALVALAEEMLAELGYEPVGFDSSPAALAAFRAAPERFRSHSHRRGDAGPHRNRARASFPPISVGRSHHPGERPRRYPACQGGHGDWCERVVVQAAPAPRAGRGSGPGAAGR